MAALSIHDLVAQFCPLIGVAPPEITCGPDGVLAFTVTVREVVVAVAHEPVSQPQSAMVHVFYGKVPLENELAVLTELLRANFYMDAPNDPAFSFNPETREVALRFAYLLAQGSGEHLLAAVQHSVDIALEWRRTHFLPVRHATYSETPSDTYSVMPAGVPQLA